MPEIELNGAGLELEERGLVLSTQVSGAVFDRRPMKPSTLRMLLLFFDRIDLPMDPVDMLRDADFGAKGRGRNPDEQFLIDSGFMTRSLRWPEKNAGSAIPANRGEFDGLDVFQARERVEPGQWAIASLSGLTPKFRPRQDVGGRAINVELFKALPIPAGDVHLQDIIDFREKNSAQLFKLRREIEGIREKVVSASDIDAAYVSSISATRRAVLDYLDAASTYGLRYSLEDWRFDISLAIAVAPLFLANASAAPYILAGIGAAKVISSAFKRPNSSPYAYMWSTHKELRGLT